MYYTKRVDIPNYLFYHPLRLYLYLTRIIFLNWLKVAGPLLFLIFFFSLPIVFLLFPFLLCGFLFFFVSLAFLVPVIGGIEEFGHVAAAMCSGKAHGIKGFLLVNKQSSKMPIKIPIIAAIHFKGYFTYDEVIQISAVGPLFAFSFSLFILLIIFLSTFLFNVQQYFLAFPPLLFTLFPFLLTKKNDMKLDGSRILEMASRLNLDFISLTCKILKGYLNTLFYLFRLFQNSL